MRIAIAAFEFIQAQLEQDNLLISTKKIGFVASNSQAKKLLLEQLPSQGPQVHDVMRDFGVECPAAGAKRCRTDATKQPGKPKKASI